jgi:hypothetical protein
LSVESSILASVIRARTCQSHERNPHVHYTSLHCLEDRGRRASCGRGGGRRRGVRVSRNHNSAASTKYVLNDMPTWTSHMLAETDRLLRMTGPSGILLSTSDSHSPVEVASYESHGSVAYLMVGHFRGHVSCGLYIARRSDEAVPWLKG